jgi:carboxymethylenebutenolidase
VTGRLRTVGFVVHKGREAAQAAAKSLAAWCSEHGVATRELEGEAVGADDVAGAAAFLRGLPASNGRVATIGYCSGGRQSVLAACTVDLDAAVDCYGGFVVGTPPEGHPLKVGPLTDRIPDLRCPLLGLFGAEDKSPSPEHVAELERLLQEAGKTYEFHSYEGAGHSFFSTDRPAYRPEAATDGWRRIFAFFDRHLQD